jgi:ubiquinone/menaquinone biosynthesis C-methylase UbiE
MSIPVCDYSDFDYKKEFWDGKNRELEELSETLALTKLLKKIPFHLTNIADIGCGFGRLFTIYQPFGKEFILFDYAENLLAQAKKSIGIRNNISFIQGNAYKTKLDSNSLDLVISIRTLHHFVDVDTFFKEINRIVMKDGYFIFELPNKRHLLNIFRFLFGRIPFNPFSKEPLFYKETFANYHPLSIKKILIDNGFEVVSSINVSFFRYKLIKKLLPTFILFKLENLFQGLFSFLNLTPSIYFLLHKK